MSQTMNSRPHDGRRTTSRPSTRRPRQKTRSGGVGAEIHAERVRLDAAIALLHRTIATLRDTSRRTMLEYKAAEYLIGVNREIVEADCQFRRCQNAFEAMMTQPGVSAAGAH
jgi:hypothetical protein